MGGATWRDGRRKRGKCGRQVCGCCDDLMLTVPWHFLSLPGHRLINRLNRLLHRETRVYKTK